MRHCSWQTISPFPSVFSTHLHDFLPFSPNLKLLSANSFSLEESKICHLRNSFRSSFNIVILQWLGNRFLQWKLMSSDSTSWKLHQHSVESIGQWKVKRLTHAPRNQTHDLILARPTHSTTMDTKSSLRTTDRSTILYDLFFSWLLAVFQSLLGNIPLQYYIMVKRKICPKTPEESLLMLSLSKWHFYQK